MKLMLGKPEGAESYTTCAFDEISKSWVNIEEAIKKTRFVATSKLKEAATSNTVITFLEGGIEIVKEAEALLEDVRQKKVELNELENSSVKPFEPTSFRDFACYTAHLKKATVGLLKKNPGSILQVVGVGLTRMLRLPFPRLNHLHQFAAKPCHYSGNHLAFHADGEEVAWPCFAALVDYELEVGVVIAREVRNATEEEALAAIGGFVLINDISLRDCQMSETAEVQFGYAKTKNAASAMARVVVTADEFLPVLLDNRKGAAAAVRVNGAAAAASATAHPSRAHGPAEMVRFASLGETLRPGELLGMGTLPNCCALENGVWLKEGDELTLEVEGLGTLTNRFGPREPWPADARPAPYEYLSYKKKSGGGTGTNKMTVLIVLLAIYLALKPNPLEPTKWQNPPPLPKFGEGGLPAVNGILAGAERLHEGEMIAPESMDNAPDGTMYLSLGDGRVVRTDPEGLHPETVFFSGGFQAVEGSRNGLEAHEAMASCTAQARAGTLHLDEAAERACGRPLGLRYASGALYFVDAHHGLFKLDLATGTATTLFNSSADAIATRAPAAAPEVTLPSRFLNDLVIMDGGKTVYFTETSYKNSRVKNRAEVVDGAPRGRLLKHDLGTGQTEALMCGLHFPNGIEASHDGKSLLLIESTRFRVLEVRAADLAGLPLNGGLGYCGERGGGGGAGGAAAAAPPPPGAAVWAAMIPGFGDNIRKMHDNKTYSIGFGVRSVKPFSFLYFVYQKPLLSKILGKIIPLRHVTKLAPKHSLVGFYDKTGKPTKIYHDPNGKTMPLVSEAHLNTVSGYLFFGSSFNSFLGRLKFSDQ